MFSYYLFIDLFIFFSPPQPEGETFEFPDLFPNTEQDENEKAIKDLATKQKQEKRTQQLRGGINSWFL